MPAWSTVVSTVDSVLGKPYVYASQDPSLGFDCSLFTQWVYQQVTGKDIGRTTGQQLQSGSVVGQDGNWALDTSLLKPGDLIFYGAPGASGPNAHVVLYMGGGHVAQAGGTNVNITQLFQSASADEPFLGVRRILPGGFSGAPTVGAGAAQAFGPAGNTSAPSLQQTTTDLETAATTAAGQLGLTANQVIAYVFLVGKGLTSAQAAGVVGNLTAESNVNPESPGGGIAQWIGNRSSNAVQTGNPTSDLIAQLNNLWTELNTTESSSLTALKATTTPAQAATVFMQTYERPNMAIAGGLQSRRIAVAQQVYNSTITLTSSGGQGLWGALRDVWNGITGILGGGGPTSAGGIANSVGSLFSGGGSLSGLTTILGDITSKDFWDRLGLFALGAALIVGGLIVFAADTAKDHPELLAAAAA